MDALDELAYAVSSPLTDVSVAFYYVLPKIIITGIVVLFGWLLGWFLGWLVRTGLERLKFDERFKRLHIARPLEKIKLSSGIAWVVKWYTFLVFAAAGAGYISLYPISDLLMKFAEWFPKLVLALAIGVAGIMAAEYVFNLVQQVKVGESRLLGSILRYIIIAVALVLALDQVMQVGILENMVLLLIAGISLGIALAFGISFGLALKDDAAEWAKAIRKK
jgi:hypothetical protein